MNFTKYRPFQPVALTDRTWPNHTLTSAPAWCSVDLRDGNQALEIPMTLDQKINFFNFLVQTGFKEIEIGFPAASDTEFLFTRMLIEQNLIPKDVTIQVLTQSREHIIARTFEALEGVHKAVVHLYNSTSTLQRAVVFQKTQEQILEIATAGAQLVLDFANKYGRERFSFEYSPESFTGTELTYATEVCNAVLDIWQPTAENKAIINLPSTVEMSMPNIYADQIEYMCRHITNRENVIISLHAHNDRGTAVAATELALLAGADRVEGTLFGNGERTGNADILNIAMNLFSQGIDPRLDFSQIDTVVDTYEKSTGLIVPPRHPYAGVLVYTAFSGSHQDAINKGLSINAEGSPHWEIPYLPIDPSDVGRSYEAIIRINSQSGKGGVAFVLEKSYGLQIPKNMQADFSQHIKTASDSQSKELLAGEIYELFRKEYINVESPFQLIGYREAADHDIITVASHLQKEGEELYYEGTGNGLLSAFCNGLMQQIGRKFEIIYYTEHSLEYGAKSRAITYMEITDAHNRHFFGAGVSSSISKSSLRAIVSAVNKMLL